MQLKLLPPETIRVEDVPNGSLFRVTNDPHPSRIFLRCQDACCVYKDGYWRGSHLTFAWSYGRFRSKNLWQDPNSKNGLIPFSEAPAIILGKLSYE